MLATLILFKPEQTPDWERLRNLFPQRVPIYATVPGLRLKTWLIDEQQGEFGAFYVWEDQQALDDFLASELFRSLPVIFSAPPVVRIFETPAMMEKGLAELATRTS